MQVCSRARQALEENGIDSSWSTGGMHQGQVLWQAAEDNLVLRQRG